MFIYIYIPSINIYIYIAMFRLFLFLVSILRTKLCSFFHVETVCGIVTLSMHFLPKLFGNTVLNVLCMLYTDGGYSPCV